MGAGAATRRHSLNGIRMASPAQPCPMTSMGMAMPARSQTTPSENNWRAWSAGQSVTSRGSGGDVAALFACG
eukprot:3267790-Prorocentrum_lima.AAC.1